MPVREMPWSDRFDAAILYDTMHHFDDEVGDARGDPADTRARRADLHPRGRAARARLGGGAEPDRGDGAVRDARVAVRPRVPRGGRRRRRASPTCGGSSRSTSWSRSATSGACSAACASRSRTALGRRAARDEHADRDEAARRRRRSRSGFSAERHRPTARGGRTRTGASSCSTLRDPQHRPTRFWPTEARSSTGWSRSARTCRSPTDAASSCPRVTLPRSVPPGETSSTSSSPSHGTRSATPTRSRSTASARASPGSRTWARARSSRRSRADGRRAHRRRRHAARSAEHRDRQLPARHAPRDWPRPPRASTRSSPSRSSGPRGASAHRARRSPASPSSSGSSSCRRRRTPGERPGAGSASRRSSGSRDSSTSSTSRTGCTRAQRGGLRTTTVHDLSPLHHPEWVAPLTRRMHGAQVRERGEDLRPDLRHLGVHRRRRR